MKKYLIARDNCMKHQAWTRFSAVITAFACCIAFINQGSFTALGADIPSGYNENAYNLQDSSSDQILGGSERFTLNNLNMQKGDVLNLTVHGDSGDTIQVHFYYTDEDGIASSSIIGGLGGTVLDSNGLKTVSFTAPNALDYVTVKVVYELSTPTFTSSVDYKTPPVTTTVTSTIKPTTTTTENPASAITAEGFCGAEDDNLTWTLDSEGVLTIAGEGKMKDWSFIEETMDITPWYNFQVNKVIINEGVTSIGNDAFFAKDISSAILPTTLESIGDGAFSYCIYLTQLKIPANVSYIGELSFDRCARMTEFIVDSSNNSFCSEDGVLFDKNKKELLRYPCAKTDTQYEIPSTVNKIYNGAFEYCKNLVNIKIPEGITEIGAFTFSCSDFEQIELPDSITMIGHKAFSFCEKLTAITLPENVSEIGNSAFTYCPQLKSVTIKNPDCSIFDEKHTFDNNANTGEFDGIIYGYKDSTAQAYAEKYGRNFVELDDYTDILKLEYIELDDGTIEITGCDKSLTEVKIPAEIDGKVVTSIGYEAFRYCFNLTSITIPDCVTSIGDSAFGYCSSLTSITIPDSVTSIGDSAFWYCSSLTSITIPNDVTSIGDSAFSSCSSLTSITIPNYVTNIGNSAFSSCSRLTSITIPDSVTNIGHEAFKNCSSLTSITIPSSVISIGNSAFSSCSKLTSITIPDSVTSIGKYVFNKCSSLTEITIPNKVTSIGDYAFYQCTGLTKLTIPDSVKNIGVCAFDSCSSLKSITIPNSITSIGNSEFARCSSLTSITLPNSVTSIGASGFYDCKSLSEITIPNSVTSIGNYAFFGCNELKSIKILNPKCEISEYAGTISDTATIYGYSGSTAQAYAEKYNRDFESFDIYVTLSVFESKTYETAAEIESVSSSDNAVAIAFVSEQKTNLSIAALKDGYTDIVVKLTNGNIYTVHLTVINNATTTTTSTTTTTTTTKPVTTTTTTSTTTTTTTSTTTTTTTSTTTTTTTSTTTTTTTSTTTTTTTSTTTTTTTSTTTTTTTSTTTTTTASTTTTTTASTTTTTATSTTTTTKIFEHSADAWSFGNVESNFADPETGEFFLFQEHIDRLNKILDHTGEYRLDKVKNANNGACYGMATLAMLNYCNIISSSDIQQGAEKLADIRMTKEVVSAINYHHLLQCSGVIQNQISEYKFKFGANERIDDLLEKIDQGPVIIIIYDDYNRKPDHAFSHAILAYECTSGQYIQNGEEYDRRLKIYDPKFPKYSEEGDMYVSSSGYRWTIPRYDDIAYDYFSPDPAKQSQLAFVMGDIDIISINNLFVNDDIKYVPIVQFHPDMLASSSYSNYKPPRRVKSGGLVGDGDDDDDDVISGFYFANGDSHEQSIRSYYMRYSKASYQFSFDDGEYKDASLDMRYENSLIDVQADSMNKAVFSPESLELTALDSDYTIHNVRNNQMTENEFYRLDISGKNAGELMFYYESGYWVLSSDSPLNRLHITAMNTTGTATKIFTTTSKNIKIYAENESTIGIMLDLDNDGIFETPLSSSDEIKLGDVSGDGLVDATDASSVLSEYSILSTGGKATFSDEQKEAADVNRDGLVDATDASTILSFYSYVSTGGAETNMREWLSL